MTALNHSLQHSAGKSTEGELCPTLRLSYCSSVHQQPLVSMDEQEISTACAVLSVTFFTFLSFFVSFCTDLLNLWCTSGGPLTHHPLTHTTSLCVSVHVVGPNSPPAHPHYQFVCVCTRGGPLTHHPLTQFVCVCTRGGPLTHHPLTHTTSLCVSVHVVAP